MKTLGRRSSRALLVAAMSTSAFAGATASAGAAEVTEPTSPDCHAPADALSTVPAFAAASACNSAAATMRGVLVEVMRTDQALRAAEPAVLKIFDVLHPEVKDCDTPPAVKAAIPDLAKVTGAKVASAPAPAVPDTADAAATATTSDTGTTAVIAKTAGTKADAGAAAAVGGVVIEETVVVEEHSVAPEQVEVVGPETAAAGGLPATGGDGALLTMLGLALLASGGAVRLVARG